VSALNQWRSVRYRSPLAPSKENLHGVSIPITLCSAVRGRRFPEVRYFCWVDPAQCVANLQRAARSVAIRRSRDARTRLVQSSRSGVRQAQVAPTMSVRLLLGIRSGSFQSRLCWTDRSKRRGNRCPSRWSWVRVDRAPVLLPGFLSKLLGSKREFHRGAPMALAAPVERIAATQVRPQRPYGSLPILKQRAAAQVGEAKGLVVCGFYIRRVAPDPAARALNRGRAADHHATLIHLGHRL